jgi:excinuclease ABC subunit B
MSSNKVFNLKSDYKPAGDQPDAISTLVKGLKKGDRFQTLLGVTGSGKTFTMANVIRQIGKPTLVIAHNKTLAAQLAQEYKTFFPDNAVHYFVSYYDFYQPEAYMPGTDTYIEKEAIINEEIDRLRHASTQALLSRKDVIIVASVSCIYGLGSPEEYQKVNMQMSVSQNISRDELLRRLVEIHFERTNVDLSPGEFRAIGNKVEVMPTSERKIYRINLENDKIESIEKIDPITRVVDGEIDSYFLFPAKHFISDKGQIESAIKSIKKELEGRLAILEKEGKPLERERLKRRTNYDLALIREVGYCNGIENYSRHFSGKAPGVPPDSLLAYFPRKADGSPDFLTVIDESHVTLPQLHGMYAGDAARKKNLVDFGFRLPSACDNRPLRFSEFEKRVGQVIFTTATPSDFERKESAQIVEQVIRPTGLIDPEITIKPITGKGKDKSQVYDVIEETAKVVKEGGRVIVTTLTKKMAEDLATFLKDKGVKAEYLHSEIKTIERIEILSNFRRGTFDCIVGVNLLREGLDLPEVEFIGILDADKEGFLRSETSLIQTIGRAARNVKGRVTLYADRITDSMKRAIDETNRRRIKQVAYNNEHGIVPKTIIKEIHDITDQIEKRAGRDLASLDLALVGKTVKVLIKEKTKEMNEAVKELDFETAAILRDEIEILEEKIATPANNVSKITNKRLLQLKDVQKQDKWPEKPAIVRVKRLNSTGKRQKKENR